MHDQQIKKIIARICRDWIDQCIQHRAIPGVCIAEIAIGANTGNSLVINSPYLDKNEVVKMLRDCADYIEQNKFSDT